MGDFLCVFTDDVPLGWSADWAWGLPLIVSTVTVHVIGLGLISRTTLAGSNRSIRSHSIATFIVVVGLTTLLVTSLHAVEAGIWAAAYRFLGALPDKRSAMLYSLNAITSYGHINLMLEDRWHLLGAMEALNGWLLFGLSTAFLFAVIQRIFPSATRPKHDEA